MMHELRLESLIIDGMPPAQAAKLGDLSKKTPQEMQQIADRIPQRNRQPLKQAAPSSEKNLRLALKERLVNGEIDLDEYRQMKTELDK
jgi:hypothetical protein